jgi:hypothetical protein
LKEVVASPPQPTLPTVDNPKSTGNFHDDTKQMILARAIFGEARGESNESRIAVGWVIKNRVEDTILRRWRGFTYHNVILEPGHFSAFNPYTQPHITHHPAIIENFKLVVDPLSGNDIEDKAWLDSYRIAGRILNNEETDPTGGATHFFSPRGAEGGWFGPYRIAGTNERVRIPWWVLPVGYSIQSPPPIDDWEIAPLYHTIDNTKWIGKLYNIRNQDFMFYRPIRADTTLPTITISSPSSGQTFTTSTITVRGSAADNVAVSRVEVRVGTGVWQLATGTTFWSGQVTLASGSNTITVWAIDVAGNIGTASVTVVVTPAPAPVPNLVVFPTAVSANLTQGAGWTTIGTVSVTNPGGGTLSWSATGDRGWLEVTPASNTTTTETDIVTVRATTAGLLVGTHRGTITFTGAGMTRTVSVSLTVAAVSPLTITTISLPNGTVGVSYSASLSASGGTTPYSWSLVGGSLPPGLRLSPRGVISGRPTSSGTFNFAVQVRDRISPVQTAQRALSITVTERPPEIEVVLRAPSNLKVQHVGFAPGGVRHHLTWDDNSDNEVGFLVQRKMIVFDPWTEGGIDTSPHAGRFVNVGRVGPNDRTYTVTTPLLTIILEYRVAAISADGSLSEWSNIGRLPAPPPIARPTDLQGEVIVYHPYPPQVRLTWDDNSNDELAFHAGRWVRNIELGFHIHRWKGKGAGPWIEMLDAEWPRLATVGANVQTFLDTAVEAGYTYRYYVVAYNDAALSHPSNVVTVFIPDTVP